MSGDIKCVHAQDILIFNSKRSLRLKTAPGRDGYVKDVYISNVTMKSASVGIIFIRIYGEHPNDRYDRNSLPYIQKITSKDILGDEITIAGFVEDIQNAHSEDIFLSNIQFNVSLDPFWNYSYMGGFLDSVYPKPCTQPQPKIPHDLLVCYSSYVSSTCTEI